MLDLLNEDAFRARAFDNAARLLEAHSGSLAEALSSNRVAAIKGIGPGVTAVLREIADVGTFHDFESASARVPAGVLELLRVDGLGPKKARALWTSANVTSLGELESAISAGKVAALSGFGAKTCANFLTSIQFIRSCEGRFLRHQARRHIDQIKLTLRDVPGIAEIYVGGSYARGLETVRDLDLLIIAQAEQLHAVEQAVRVSPIFAWNGSTELFWTGKIGEMQVELQIIPEQLAAPKKLIVTGSKPHYAALQARAKSLGMTLEHDRLCNSDGEHLQVKSEADIYRALRLRPLPAALRESDKLRLDADATVLPQAVQRSDFRGILHCHSTYSDGKNSLREMALAMVQQGFEYLGIADHSRVAAYANGLSPERVREQWQEIDRLNSELAPFRILKGTECDILADGRLDFDDDLLSQFDFVVASIHSGFTMTEADSTARLCTALENPHVDILGHPTGRLLLERSGYPVQHEQLIDCAARHSKSIELNANPHRLDIDWKWIEHCTNSGVPVPINPDAHSIEGLHDIEYGIDVAAKASLTAANCLSTWSASELIDWCKSHGAK